MANTKRLVRTSSGFQLIGSGVAGAVEAAETGAEQTYQEGVTGVKIKPTFTSGGGGRVPKPKTPEPETLIPTPKGVPEVTKRDIEAERRKYEEIQKESREIERRARENRVSFEIQAARDRAENIKKLRGIAEKQSRDITTKAKERGFVESLKEFNRRFEAGELTEAEKQKAVKEGLLIEEKQTIKQPTELRDISGQPIRIFEVDIKGSFTSGRIKEGKYSVPAYLESKFGEFDVWLTKKLSKIPETSNLTIKSDIIIPQRVTEGGQFTIKAGTYQVPTFTGDLARAKINFRVTDLAKFTLFSQAMQTGAAQKSQYVQDMRTGKFIRLEDVRSHVKKMSDSQLKTWAKKQLSNIKTASLSNAEKQAQENILKAIILEKKTGTSIILESGGVDILSAQKAQAKLQSAPIIKIKAPQMEQVGTVAKASTLLKSDPSIYQGMGQYERTAEVTGRLKPNVMLSQNNLFFSGQAQNQIQRQTQLQLSKLASALKTSQLTKQTQKQQQDQTQRLSQVQLSALATAQQQAQRQKQDQRLRLKLRTRGEGRGQQEEPTKSINLWLPDGGARRRIAKRLEKEPDLFKVYGKRFGKDFEIGEYKTKQKAEKELSKFLRGTLGRSGYLTKDGEKIKADLISKEYRKSKVDPFRLVQRKEFALSGAGEKQEISFWRKKKSKKKKYLWFN